jgi:hypothetical protein
MHVFRDDAARDFLDGMLLPTGDSRPQAAAILGEPLRRRHGLERGLKQRAA